jgi:hypothetical protein
MATVLHSSAPVGTCCVTRRCRQMPLNCNFTTDSRTTARGKYYIGQHGTCTSISLVQKRFWVRSTNNLKTVADLTTETPCRSNESSTVVPMFLSSVREVFVSNLDNTICYSEWYSSCVLFSAWDTTSVGSRPLPSKSSTWDLLTASVYRSEIQENKSTELDRGSSQI